MKKSWLFFSSLGICLIMPKLWDQIVCKLLSHFRCFLCCKTNSFIIQLLNDPPKHFSLLPCSSSLLQHFHCCCHSSAFLSSLIFMNSVSLAEFTENIPSSSAQDKPCKSGSFLLRCKNMSKLNLNSFWEEYCSVGISWTRKDIIDYVRVRASGGWRISTRAWCLVLPHVLISKFFHPCVPVFLLSHIWP